ncbi:MAG: hypothetical protein WBP81_08415 [Solirubrobacteraceae bacterium]
MSRRSIIDRSSALFFLTSTTNLAALVVAGALLAERPAAGPYDLLRAGIPIFGGLSATAPVLAIPILVRRSPQRSWPSWLVDLSAGISRARRSLLRPSWRLLGALGYLGFDIAALGAIFAATGHPLPATTLVLGYLIGYLANLIPTPGGFGVLEGGLAGTPDCIRCPGYAGDGSGCRVPRDRVLDPKPRRSHRLHAPAPATQPARSHEDRPAEQHATGRLRARARHGVLQRSNRRCSLLLAPAGDVSAF